MSWRSSFPSEMHLGDQWGEKGEIVELAQTVNQEAWRITLRQPNGSTWVENHWPEQAPMRVLCPHD